MGSTNMSAFFIAICIGFVTALLLFLVAFPEGIVGIFATAGLIGAVSFLLIRLGHRWLVYSEMRRLYARISTRLPARLKHPYKLTCRPSKDLEDIIDAFALSQQTAIDALKKQESFRTNFLADVSHELKTPIFAIQGFLHTLLDGAMDDTKVRKRFLQKAAKNMDGLNVMVHDLLTLSQIETGAVKMKFENIDLYQLCAEVVEQFEQRGVDSIISIQPSLPDSLIIVRADWSRIVQVMNNLISNAVKYTEATGNITIRFDVDSQWVTTSVIDTGIGIPTVHLDRIFERFYRVDKSRSKEKGGTGLGLSIVKHILEQHSTRISVQSRPGEGSTFSFKLQRVGHANRNFRDIMED